MTRMRQDDAAGSPPQGAPGVDWALHATLAAEHGQMVDRKFTEGLSPEEEARLEELDRALDAVLEPFYRPIIEHLEQLATVAERSTADRVPRPPAPEAAG